MNFQCLKTTFMVGNVLTIFYMCSYRQNVPVDFIARELAFDSSFKAGQFLNKFHLSYSGNDQSQIDCKASLPAVASI